ncbi:phosphatase PAP2 family protein [Ottowia sp.]|uniref:phosphatase PAP2 family protein n=1 Tax=Ottowia sp. TaxID=1898956 RepID=UPI001D5AF1D3|nr:phosphatase PAP2 family protein [Ottowia sp.]MCB2025712.1 phosphatase PAP2 family protein [Ottowia sp.]MCP5256378.1 phosphatase PAP2 family protein [Burkholderiaceae bacterium]HPK31988.1 phosphatase PAP2 family protein [Ottowia sp.]HRW71889.1 phosphatase PAP2 family protein [Ottowia sp.]
MTSIDHALFLWINLGADTPRFWLALARFSSLALIQWLPVVIVTLALAGTGLRRQAAWRVLASVAVAALVVHLLKPFFHVDRPFALGLGTRWLEHGADPSFPSAHAAALAAMAVAVLLTPLRWPVKAVAVALALLVSWSRVALGLHFPSDVLAAWCVGALAALAVRWAWTRLQPCASAWWRRASLSLRGRS